LDEAIRLREAMDNFLRQDMHLGEDESVTRANLRTLLES